MHLTLHDVRRNGTTTGTAKLHADESLQTLIHSDILIFDKESNRTRFAKKAAELYRDHLRKKGELKPETVSLETRIGDWLLNQLKSAETVNGEEQDEFEQPEAPPADLLIPSTRPLTIADHFVRNRYTDGDGNALLRRYRGDWWRFDGSGYSKVEEEAIVAEGYNHLGRLWTPERMEGLPTGKFKQVVPGVAMIRELLSAMPSRGIFVDSALSMPRWIDEHEGAPPAKNIVAFANGLLDVEAYRTGDVRLITSTPHWFSSAWCPYKFDPEAKSKLWTDTVAKICDGDEDSLNLLQEWFGLQLVPDNSHEKFFVMQGQGGAGKGTIFAGMNTMLGEKQVAVTSLGKLAGRFALYPLLGKLAAVLPDAHLKKDDGMAALEVIKTITGGDQVSIDIKRRDELPIITMPLRFTLGVNELPEFPDDARTLMRRLLIIQLVNQFEEGKTDTTLKTRIAREGPGIAVWALEGLCRLREQGRFTEPKKSQSIRKMFERTISPILQFTDDRCVIGPNLWTEKQTLYDAWCKWCKANGQNPGAQAGLARKLTAAFGPKVDPDERTGDAASRHRVFGGIGLLPDAE